MRKLEHKSIYRTKCSELAAEHDFFIDTSTAWVEEMVDQTQSSRKLIGWPWVMTSVSFNAVVTCFANPNEFRKRQTD